GVAGGACWGGGGGAEASLPVLEALDDLLRGDAAAARLLKAVAPTWYAQVAPRAAEDPAPAHPAEEASPERMKRELSAFVHELARLRPVVLFLDDLHWADASTVDLLAYLGARGAACRLRWGRPNRPP